MKPKTKIRNATTSITIEVTKSDVLVGKRRGPEACAAARALCRTPGVAEAKVHTSTVYLKNEKGKWTRYRTPGRLRDEIVSFDRAGVFSPGTYTLKPIQPSHRATGKRQGTRGGNKGVPMPYSWSRYHIPGIRANASLKELA